MTFRRARRLRAIASVSLFCALSVVAAVAADAPSRNASASAATAHSSLPLSAGTVLKPARPYWIELTIAQREALAPLADDWERLDVQTKKKWVEIGNRYPRMSADEQARTQQRMREWALLTPDQRRVARDSFARIRQMPPEQRADLLRKYQELPPEKRQALVTEGRASKVIVVPKPSTTPVPRRAQISEGAKAGNPAVAAQKGANPLLVPARPRAPAATGSPVSSPAPAAAETPAAGPGSAMAPAPVSTPAMTNGPPPIGLPPSGTPASVSGMNPPSRAVPAQPATTAP